MTGTPMPIDVVLGGEIGPKRTTNHSLRNGERVHLDQSHASGTSPISVRLKTACAVPGGRK